MARILQPMTGTPTSGSPSIGQGRAIVAVVVVYVLMLYQLPLVPLVTHVLHRPGHAHAPCTSTSCYCAAGCRCAYHANDTGHDGKNHSDKGHAEVPSFSTCVPPGAAVPFILPALDKALLADGLTPQQPVLPRLQFAGGSQALLPPPLFDIFHPPRLA